MVLRSSGQAWTCCVAEDGFELLVLLLLSRKYWAHWHTCLLLLGLGFHLSLTRKPLCVYCTPPSSQNYWWWYYCCQFVIVHYTFFWDEVSLSSTGWPGPCCTGPHWPWIHADLPASAFWAKALKLYPTMWNLKHTVYKFTSVEENPFWTHGSVKLWAQKFRG